MQHALENELKSALDFKLLVAQVAGRAGHVMATWNGQLVVHGGAATSAPLNDVWMLDTQSFVWTRASGKRTGLSCMSTTGSSTDSESLVLCETGWLPADEHIQHNNRKLRL